jgi:hypothetical protein
MEHRDMEDKERVVRRTLPTFSYTLKQSNGRWLQEEAERRGMRGPSELLREILDEKETTAREIVATDTDQRAA